MYLQYALFKCDQLVRDRLIIVLKADKCCLNERTVKSGKLVITECTCHFTGTVRTEVKEDHGIILFTTETGFPFSVITVGSTNSSVTSFA